MKLWGGVLFLLLIVSIATHSYGLGVNWGTQSNYQLDPKVVVKLLQKNNIRQLKLFDSESKTLKALVGSGIEVMVAIPNVDLLRMSDPGLAKTWLKTHILPFCTPDGVNITYVAVGNEPFLMSYNGSFVNITYPALQNVQNALNDAKLGDKIKATIPLNADVLTSSTTLPSDGAFRDDIKDLMIDIVTFLNKNGAPVTINIYPFLSLYADNNFPKEYAFFDGNGSVKDGTATYTNSFIASFDTLVAALKKVGLPDEEIIIGEVGWPTDGDSDATIANARRFNQGFLDHMQKNLGTPLRPNKEIKYYLFGLLDEEAKSVAPGNFERHWGIFKYNGDVKYPLRLPGIGDNSTPTSLVGAKNVAYLQKKWCVFNIEAIDTSKLGDSITYACTYADCTPLGYGCSCNLALDANGNASYAFNQYYQVQRQRSDACDFNGLAQITTTDPSINSTLGNCIFPLALDVSTDSSLSPPLPCNLLKIWLRMTLVGFLLLLIW